MIRAAVLAWALVLGAVAPGMGQGQGGKATVGRDTVSAAESAARSAGPVGPAGRDTTSVSDSMARSADADTVPVLDLREQVLQKLRALEAASRPMPVKQAAEASKAAGDTAGAEAVTGGVAGQDSARAVVDPTRQAADITGAAGDTTLTAKHPATTTGRVAAGTPDSGVAPGAPGGRGRTPVSGVILASDSMVALLRALEGYVVTEYQSTNARYDAATGQLDLVGEPRLARGTESMTADSLLRFDQKTSIVCGYGKPVLTGTGSDPVASEEVCYDVDRQVGVAMGARTTFTQQGTWFVHGKEFYTEGTDRLYGSATSFSSCDLDEPHYHFAASEMKVVHDNIMVARNVTLKFGDVPVFWLPFLIQSLKPDRRSGLLTPTLGLQHVVRTSTGYRREIRNIGFYWAMTEHLGLTTAMDWQSGGYTALTGRLQYRWLRQFLGGDINFSRYWMADGRITFALSGNTNWQPGERTSLRSSVNYASSNDFVRRYSVDPEELNRSIDSNAGITHRFDWGNFSLNASRRQHLSNDQVDLTLPSVTLSINPITLFPGTGDLRWYNNATWQSNASFTARSREVNVLLPSERGQSNGELTGRVDTRLSVGKLSWGGNFDFSETVLQARPARYDSVGGDVARVDTTEYFRSFGQKMGWSTNLSYTQRLIENTHFSPSISMNGGLQILPPDSLGRVYGRVAEPTRVNFGASLRTNLFGFFPGVGPYSRIRHRLEPSLSYTYSPVPTVTPLQQRVFGSRYDGLRETNRITLNFSQTFEAKPREREAAGERENAGAAEDTVAGVFGETPPRRSAQTQPITLLAINSSALAYDFVRAREEDLHNPPDVWNPDSYDFIHARERGYGFITEQMTHSIRSDLVRGLSLSIGHDLFRVEPAAAGGRAERSFSPRLRSVDAQFSLNSDSWPFRLLRSGEGASTAAATESEGVDALADSAEFDDQNDIARSVIPGSGRSMMRSAGGQAVGTWRGDFGYSLMRPPAGSTALGNQMLRAGVSFQPTENWSVDWRTTYSFTTHEFSDHVLSLTRDLHRWRASFNFVRTQTGSFAFRFNVQLLDNPDIKVDYDQRSQSPAMQYR